MIHVRAKIFSQAIPDSVDIELDGGSLIETLLIKIEEKLKCESREGGSKQIAFLNNTKSLVILLNGTGIYTLAGWETVLQEGDEVSFLPMLAGG